MCLSKTSIKPFARAWNERCTLEPAWFPSTQLASQFPHFHLSQHRFQLCSAMQSNLATEAEEGPRFNTLPGSLQPFFVAFACASFAEGGRHFSLITAVKLVPALVSLGSTLTLTPLLLASLRWIHFLSSLPSAGFLGL